MISNEDEIKKLGSCWFTLLVCAVTGVLLLVAVKRAAGARNERALVRRLLERGGLVVVTGASSGIGRAFCAYFARCGLRVLAVARRAAELETLRAEAAGHAELEVLALDLSTEAGVDTLFGALEGREVAAFVHSAGFCHSARQFVRLPEEEVARILQLNVVATTHVFRGAARLFRRQRHGLFVMMSSGSSFGGAALLSVYAATKAFANALVQSLNAECRAFGAHFAALCPLWVDTAMTKQFQSSIVFLVPDAFVREAVRSGLQTRELINPNLWHRLALLVRALVPAFVRRRAALAAIAHYDHDGVEEMQ